MKEEIKKPLFELLRAILAAIVAFVTALLSTGCGSTTRATIRNFSDSNSVEVSITTNNPTNWTVSPNTDVELGAKRGKDGSD